MRGHRGQRDPRICFGGALLEGRSPDRKSQAGALGSPAGGAEPRQEVSGRYLREGIEASVVLPRVVMVARHVASFPTVLMLPFLPRTALSLL